MEKTRVDDLLVQKGLAQDRKEALALILSGAVLANEQRVDRPAALLAPDTPLRLKKKSGPYVSRAGLKLEAALKALAIDVTGLVCADLGASTGGFTDCLLKRGARKIYALDVGKGQLDWKLQKDPRVIVRDGVNVRYLRPDDVGERIELITIDLSFISLRLVLPSLKAFAPVRVLALVKPQFEAERGEVGAGGIIRDPQLQEEIVERVSRFAAAEGYSVLGTVPSGLRGQKGNQEYFLLLET
jgi:23S rRNA (cytidine1920-2'-O)/16S rRNA (cytidine1409-2'-O)-methyltransferase